MPIDLYTADERIGVTIDDFDLRSVTGDEAEALKEQVYRHKVIVLRRQFVSPADLVRIGGLFGEVVPYYEPMYHHPDQPEVFVSSNVLEDGRQVGVPRTGRFWHADYQFMPRPFAFTIFAPQLLPETSRGTYFIDMTAAYAALPDELRAAVAGTTAVHSVRNYFKIRPSDVYRPLSEIIREVDERTPPQRFPTAYLHPVTAEPILYVSQGFTQTVEGSDRPDLLSELLEASGQLDPEQRHPLIRRHAYEPGDVVIWDNRSLVHRALHSSEPAQPTVSHRVTVLDGLPLFTESL
jgi:taurine dioxygenase